jgi:flagellar motility protein MotE (MotC chaperone)
MLQRFRILPLLILVSVAMLTLKVGSIWHEITGLNASLEARSVRAAEEKPAEKAKQEASATAAPGDQAAEPGAEGKLPSIMPTTTPAAGDSSFDPRDLSQSEVRLLQALAERRKSLDAREYGLNQRDALLKAAEQRLLDKEAELTSMRTEVKQLLDQVDEQETKKINNLVKLYENMKPKDAARILNDLELGVLMRVVQRMNVRKLAPVMAAMEADRARAVTRSLAQGEKAQKEAMDRMKDSIAERK